MRGQELYVEVAAGLNSIAIVPLKAILTREWLKLKGPRGHKMANPRYKNGNLRRKYRARFKAMNAPCGICHGRLGEIHYDEPSDSKHPLSFVIDEIKPVSRWKEFGYPSPEAACRDWSNLQAAHYCCNQAKSNHVASDRKVVRIQAKTVLDGDW